jgi:hypothetical protein
MATTTYNVFSEATEGDITIAAGSDYTIMEMTMTDYEGLATKAANVLYVITED